MPHDHDLNENEHHHPHHAAHDLGGRDHGEVVLAEHTPSDLEKDIDALVNLLALREVALVRPDERRRGIEELPPDIYFSADYYQRWLLGVTNMLILKGLLSADEALAEMARLKSEGDA